MIEKDKDRVEAWGVILKRNEDSVMTVDECRDVIVNAVMSHYGGKRDEEPLLLLSEELWRARMAEKILKKMCNVDVSSNMSLLDLIKRI